MTAAADGYTSVDECRLVSLRTVDDPRGSLTIVEASATSPFRSSACTTSTAFRPVAAGAVTPTGAWSRS